MQGIVEDTMVDETSPQQRGAGNPVVLLVEDDERSRIVRGELFSLEGCDVIDVKNLAEALAVLQSGQRVDAVVTDINLGGRDTNRDGLLLAHFVRKRFENLPIVAYTAFYGEDEIALEDQRLFDRWYPRGTLTSLRAHVTSD